MHQELIKDVYKKAKEKLVIEEGIKAPSDSAIAKYLIIALEDFQVFIHERTLRNHFNKAIKDNDPDTIIPKQDVIKGICNFLGFQNFEEYLKSKKKAPVTYKIKAFFMQHKYAFMSAATVFLIMLGVNKFNQQRWMVWKGDHYEEVAFDTRKYELNQLRLYKEERILYFKKIHPNCDTEFFNQDGTERIWYGKNNRGELEYFTSQGLHPQTKRTLKKITPYMINKYICKKENTPAP